MTSLTNEFPKIQFLKKHTAWHLIFFSIEESQYSLTPLYKIESCKCKHFIVDGNRLKSIYQEEKKCMCFMFQKLCYNFLIFLSVAICKQIEIFF